MNLDNTKMMAATLDGIKYGKELFLNDLYVIERSHYSEALKGTLRIELWNKKGIHCETIVTSKEEYDAFWEGVRSIYASEVLIENKRCEVKIENDDLRYYYIGRRPWQKELKFVGYSRYRECYDYEGVVKEKEYSQIIMNSYCVQINELAKLLLQQELSAVNL